MPFNSLFTEFFEGSDKEELIQRIFTHIRTQVKNPQMPESGFALDKIMHLYINFHKPVLTRCSSHTKLPEWVPRKKTVINPKKNHEQGFK